VGIVIINALKRDARSRPASRRIAKAFDVVRCSSRTHCSICQTNHDWFAKEG